jgi:single-strand DNA-binding protein
MANEPVVTLIGNCAGEPELRFLPSGVAVCNFTVASTPRVKQGDQWADGETMWVRCAAWRELGEHTAESLVKGTRVLVQGRLRVRSYDKDGEKRTSIEMDVYAVGPELRYATAKVSKAERSGAARQQQAAAVDDPWAAAPGDEPPF